MACSASSSSSSSSSTRLWACYALELTPGHSVHVALLQGVANAAALKQAAVAGQVAAALVKPAMVRCPEQMWTCLHGAMRLRMSWNGFEPGDNAYNMATQIMGSERKLLRRA